VRVTRSVRLAALCAFGAALAGSLPANPGAGAADRDCPWIVRPYVSEAVLSAGRPAFDIVYDGLERRQFYGFTVRSKELAHRLQESGSLPSLDSAADPLEPVTTPLDSEVYRLAPAAMWPATIYLVASEGRVPDLERIGAAIRPSRPTAVSTYVPRFRGGSDWSGALPPPSLDATAMVTTGPAPSQTLTVCAYEIAAR
jgi:hypothetical protein